MSKASLLIVDDTPANIQLLAQMLLDQDYDVRPTNSGKRALEAALAAPPDLVLLDVNMPEMNGYEVCLQFKANEKLKDIPVIFLSALDDVTDKVAGFRVGGVDYITKPYQLEEVLARIHTHLELRARQKEVEQLREWERGYMQQMNKLKDDVLGIVSHDLKNPLGVIIGNVSLLEEILREENSLSEDVQRRINAINRSTQRIETLIRDLLDLARMEGRIETENKPVAFIHMLKMNLEDFVLSAQKKNITLVFTPPAEDIQIEVAPERMDQAIHNLLSNSIKYTPDGGRVELKGSIYPDHVSIQVIDNGMGIPEKDLPHLFEKFYRVDRTAYRQKTGSGLGMAIVKAVVEQHHGTVTADSQVGVGTTFTVTLPRHTV